MFKKQSLLMILSLAATTTFANAPRSDFSGYYAGVNLGVLNTSARINTSASSIFYINSDEVELFALSSSPENRLWQNSMLGSLTAGYGDFINQCFHWAAEAYLSLSNRRAFSGFATSVAELSSGDSVYGTLNNSTTTHLHKVEFGIDILPGYRFETCSLAYFRIGIGFNELDLESNSVLTVTGEDDSVTYFTPLYSNEDNNKLGIRLGFGIEHQFCPHITLCGDYIFSYYGSADLTRSGDTYGINKDGAGELVVYPNGFFTNGSTHLFTQAITVGFKYYFL